MSDHTQPGTEDDPTSGNGDGAAEESALVQNLEGTAKSIEETGAEPTQPGSASGQTSGGEPSGATPGT